MACTGNWVCFDCRITKSRPTWSHVTYIKPWLIGTEGNLACSQCNKKMKFLGPSVKVPPRHKKKEWENLFKEVTKFRTSLKDSMNLQKIRRNHELEKRIIELERRPINQERNKVIKNLKEEIREKPENNFLISVALVSKIDC